MDDPQGAILLRGANVVALTDGMYGQESTDILDCLMYSEIKAGDGLDGPIPWSVWMSRYQGALMKSGLPCSGVLKSGTRSISHHRELPHLASNLINAYGHRQLGSLAKSALETLLRSPHAKTFFQEWFSNDLTEKMQLVPCRRVSSGHIEVMICGMQLVTESTEGGWFERPTSNMTLHVVGGAYLYDQQAFNTVREKLRARLDRHAGKYFDSLRIQRI